MATFPFFLACLFAIVAFCAGSRTEADSSILYELLSSKFTGFVKLLDESDLLGELDRYVKNGGVTVLAPTDNYLSERVPPAILNFLTQPGNRDHLRKVLQNHILYGKVGSSSWLSNAWLRTLCGDEVHMSAMAGTYKVNSATVKEFNVLESADGILHSIHGFLIPEDVAEAFSRSITNQESVAERRWLSNVPLQSASAPTPSPSLDLYSLVLSALRSHGTYETLISVITRSLLTSLVQRVGLGYSYTISAPDDTAFAGLSTYGKLNESQYSEIILYHVIIGAYSYDELTAIGNGSLVVVSSPAPAPAPVPSAKRRLLAEDTGLVNTLKKETLPVSTDNTSGVLTVRLGTSIITVKDILNGDRGIAIQGIDNVILPPNLFSPPPPVLSPVTYGALSPPPPPPSAGFKISLSYLLCFTLTLLAALGTLM